MKGPCTIPFTGLIMAFLVAPTAFAQVTNPPPALAKSTNGPTMLPDVTVVGQPVPGSLTSPSVARANAQKQEIPGGYTVKTTEEMNLGRASNFQDLLQGVPGLFMQSENGMEISKV